MWRLRRVARNQIELNLAAPESTQGMTGVLLQLGWTYIALICVPLKIYTLDVSKEICYFEMFYILFGTEKVWLFWIKI